MEDPKDETTKLSAELEKVKLEEKEPNVEHEADNDAPAEDANQNGTQLDDDENEQNPAFIPKKGKYYMHDSRDDGPEEAASRKTRADGNWKHDRFDERWQRPKSQKQLVTKYGFDIRRGESQEDEVEDTEQKPAEEQREQRDEQRPARDKLAPRARRGERIARVARVPQERPQPLEKAGKSRSEEREEETREADVDNEERRAPRRRRPNEEVEEEMGADRRQRLPPKTIRNVRGGRGAPRGNFSRTNVQTRERRFDDREPRQDYGRENIRYERRDYRDETDQRREERAFENHRRGVMRGAVRGAYSAPPRSYQNNRGDHRGSSGPQPPRNNYNAYPPQRGSYQNGTSYVGRGTSYGRGASSRGTLRGNSGNYYRGGSHSNRRPASDRFPPSNLHGPMSNNAPRRPRQPTDAVYFDPGQQRNAPPPAPRNKNILEIVPPS